jgi:hypothetical protein
VDRSTDRARRFRALAEELRTCAEGMSNPDARQTMIRLAESYELMADHAEAQTENLDRKAR